MRNRIPITRPARGVESVGTLVSRFSFLVSRLLLSLCLVILHSWNEKRQTRNEQRISVLVLQSLETRGRSAIQPIAHDHQRHQADGADAQPDIFKHSVN